MSRVGPVRADCGSPGSAAGGATRTGADARASARRTVSIETPARWATAINVNPSARRAPISTRFASVSFDGPFGPGRRPASAVAPCAAYSPRQRIKLSSFTPNAAATWRWRAAFVSTSCTAASRRAARSPAAQNHAAVPHRNTAPDPSSASLNVTPSATRTIPPAADGCGRGTSSARAVITITSLPTP